MTGVYIFWRGGTQSGRCPGTHLLTMLILCPAGTLPSRRRYVAPGISFLFTHARSHCTSTSICGDMNERTISEMTSRAPRHLLEQLVLDDVQHALELTEDKHTMRADH